MTDKEFNVFDEYASRYVQMSPQEEECNSSSWGDNKMSTFGSIASLQTIIT